MTDGVISRGARGPYEGSEGAGATAAGREDDDSDCAQVATESAGGKCSSIALDWKDDGALLLKKVVSVDSVTIPLFASMVVVIVRASDRGKFSGLFTIGLS